MDIPPLMLARNSLRTTMVLVGLVVIMVSAIVRKHQRMSRRRRSDRDDAAALEASLSGHSSHTSSGGRASR